MMNSTTGKYSIVIGDNIICEDDYKLIIHTTNPLNSLEKIDIEETMTEREYYLISKTIDAVKYLYNNKI